MQDSNFLNNNIFVIDEKVGMFKFENSYAIYNSESATIGKIQQNISGFPKFLRLFFNKNMLPFQLDIKDSQENILASLSRGWTFFMSEITIRDEKGEAIATLKQKFGLKLKFEIKDPLDRKIGTIQGNWSGWEFTITDEEEKMIGTISKKWNGLSKELFTSADKYIVELNNAIGDPKKRMAVIAAATTIDMIGHEK